MRTTPIRSLALFGLLALCLVAFAWMFWPRPIVDLPGLTRQEVLALGESPEDRHRLFVHLSGVLLGRGQELGPWQKLPAEAQPVWTTLYAEARIESPNGLQSFLPGESRPAGSPTLDDAATGYREMGSAELATCMSACARSLAERHGASDDFAKQYQALIGAARTARVAYQREHAAALVP